VLLTDRKDIVAFPGGEGESEVQVPQGGCFRKAASPGKFEVLLRLDFYSDRRAAQRKLAGVGDALGGFWEAQSTAGSQASNVRSEGKADKNTGQLTLGRSPFICQLRKLQNPHSTPSISPGDAF
jgi:hypothetical protein